MNESDARRALLVRAFETPPGEPWSAADAEWASREAARTLGEAGSADALIAARARLAAGRLVQRRPALAAALSASAWPRGLSVALVVLATLLGLASDAVGAGGRIHLLAPPLLGLLAWNLAVYVALALSALPGGARPAAPGPLRRTLGRALPWLLRRGTGDDASSRPAVARFLADWLDLARSLHAARIASALHLAAIAFALGLLASLYLRGIAFEYRAGWDSTFLSPAAVQQLLSIVLGPAARLAGIALPDVEHVAALRFALGPGENAAAWIHLIALTVALGVLLPRALLAAVAGWRARTLADHVALPLADPYFERLLRSLRGTALNVRVQPYSYQLPPERQAALGVALERELGARVAWQLAPSVAIGDEEALAPAPAGTGVVALFALAATPERDSQGVFLDALERANGAAPRVLIDESRWRERFPASRLAERRELWRRWLHERGHPDESIVFADLAAAAPDAKERAA